MAEFFLELFCEEIPARLQARAGEELARRGAQALQSLRPRAARVFSGPRRIALALALDADDSAGASTVSEARGPREGAPEAAVAGFLGKYQARREELVLEGGYHWLRRALAPRSARGVIEAELGRSLREFPWPKTMRWGASGSFAWVRPLRRIVALLDGEVVPVTLGPVTADNETEGHRFHAPGAFSVASAADWERGLRARRVIADAALRKAMIAEALADCAAERGLTAVADAGLLEEVTGLVEWPVVLIGVIDARFMDLPHEVRELSMKVNQRYFALRAADGSPAPFFAFAANIEAADQGAAIIAGNERVLRARLADARHFWDLDRRTPLDELLPKLGGVTFHARLGSQRDRAERIAALARRIADALGADGYEAREAEWAGRLAKADLVSGMVGEFPELQGIMGGYYAKLSTRGWDPDIVGLAIGSHYQPKGPHDAVPRGIVPCAVALADKLDQLSGFFSVGEKPTGSGDPLALRRAALGVIRIIRENGLRLGLRGVISGGPFAATADEVVGFIAERLRVMLRGEGARHDVLDAVFAAGADDDILRLLARSAAVAALLAAAEGGDLLTAYRRAANILRIETTRDGPHDGPPDSALLVEIAERVLAASLSAAAPAIAAHLAAEEFPAAMTEMARLRDPVDAFFTAVTVNAAEPELRRNRLRLLAGLVTTMTLAADFSRIES